MARPQKSDPAGMKTMNRFDLSKRLAARLTREDAIVAGIGLTNFDLWAAARERPQNFYMLGSMGLALPIALGVALAQPQRKVISIESDGSLLMQLGVLGTIAAHRVGNLVAIVWDNETYQITGGQPTATARGADLVAIARGSGIQKAHWARDERHFEALVEEAVNSDGPFFIAAKMMAAAVETTHRDPAALRERFMRGLGVRKDPHLRP
jgi:thiamine pyrophosphate-dependent acetolactate synthase large subunit-like protein